MKDEDSDYAFSGSIYNYLQFTHTIVRLIAITIYNKDI